jgi:hypothetical protein
MEEEKDSRESTVVENKGYVYLLAWLLGFGVCATEVAETIPATRPCAINISPGIVR